MKLKRLGALTMTLALTLSLWAVPAHAVQFTDVPSNFWGYEDITKMANLGYAKGYEDGSFKPNGKMTAAETLLFCARATGIDSSTQAKIAADRKKEMTQILPSTSSINIWAAAEMAVAVESGVLSLAELEALSQIDPASVDTSDPGNVPKTYLEETMTRENICMYLVRAMQLEPLSKSLSSYPLSYLDKSDISPSLQPYVYILTNYGIVKGKETGNFDPQGAVTRAEMTTMLCRALNFMEDAGIETELSEYTSYDWQAGTITAITKAADGSIILTLSSELSGTSQAFSLPATAEIYKDNMLDSSSALEVGKYVRLNLTSRGAVQSARLSGILTTYSGSVSQLQDGQLSLRINGQVRNYTIDRFTQVAVGKNVGNRNLIDEDAGYTSAICYVDEMEHLAGVRFSGGTQMMEGLIESVSTTGNVTTLGLTAFNGVVYHYTVPSGIAVTVNGALGSLSTAQVGKYAQIRVATDTNQAASIAVDTVSSYIQGPIKRLGTVGTARSVYITDTFTGKEVSYTVSQSAAITYNGEVKTLAQIESGWYVTVVVSGNMIVQIDAYPGSVSVEGTLTSITYDTSNLLAVLQITLNDDSVVSYNLDITDLPTIVRNGKTSSIDQLRTGDSVTLTVRYNEVEKIESTPQTANLTGTINRVTLENSGVVIDVTLSDGTDISYNISDGVSVTQAGVSSNIYNLKPGYTVALVTSGSEVVSIDITATASSSTRLTGTVLLTSSTSSAKTMTVQVTNSLGKTSLVVVNVKNASLMNLSGSSLNLSSGFAAGDIIEAYGSYDGATFVATIIIKQ